MLTESGEGSIITGTSTHNQRIEKLWRDVFEGILSYFYNLFYPIEDLDILDSLNQVHLAALHYIYMDELKRRLESSQASWSGHRIRLLQNPVWIPFMQDYVIDGYFDVASAEEGGRPILESFSNLIGEECREILGEEIHHTYDNYAIDEL